MVFLFILILTQSLLGTVKLFSMSKKCLGNNFFRNKCFPCLATETKRNVDFADLRTFSAQPMKTKEPIAAKRKLNDEPIRPRGENMQSVPSAAKRG